MPDVNRCNFEFSTDVEGNSSEDVNNKLTRLNEAIEVAAHELGLSIYDKKIIAEKLDA